VTQEPMTDSSIDQERRVLRLWVRTSQGATPEEREFLELISGEGVRDDHTRGAKRHVTLFFADDWAEAEHAIGRDVDPVGRRANLFLSGGGGASLIGKTVQLGEAVVDIQSETAPCHIMNAAAKGLEEAMRPNCRGGVWGLIQKGGTVRRGDKLTAGTRS